LINRMTDTVLAYEPRAATVHIELLPQSQPGHLDYALDVHLKGGLQMTFGTTLAPEGRVLVRHLKRQHAVVQRRENDDG